MEQKLDIKTTTTYAVLGQILKKLVFKSNTKYMLICGHLNTFPNIFGEMVFDISNTKYQILFVSLTLNIIIITKHNK